MAHYDDDNFPEEYSDCSDTAEYEDQLTDLTDIKIQSVMTDMTEMTPLPDDINPTEYFAMEALKNKIFSNAPNPIEYFIGEQHESIYSSLYDDLTYDNMNPFIVLLGAEGIGKTTIATSICNELLHEHNQLFKDGILYLDLMHWYNEHEYKTLEECLIASVHQSGLDSHWISKHDDFLELLPSNIFSKIDEYLSNSLIIIEDFDRFTDANQIPLEQCSQFLFSLFENISLQTKIVVTSRKKLPVYYNFNAFRTKFYEIGGFDEADAIRYLITYCCSFRREDITPYIADIRDLTSYKPLYMRALYKLWQSVRLFESTFDAIITLYQQLDHPQLLMQHNPYNSKPLAANSIQNRENHDPNGSEHVQKANTKFVPAPIQTNKDNADHTDIDAQRAYIQAMTLTVSQSNPAPQNGATHVLSDMNSAPVKSNSTAAIDEQNEIHELQGLQPLFAYTNLYCAPNSPSLVEYHSPLSTMNPPALVEYRPKKKKKKSKKHTRPRSVTSELLPIKDVHQTRKRKGSVGLNLQLLDPKRRRSSGIQSFYKVNTIAKHTQRYSFDANALNTNNNADEVRQLVLPSDRDDSKDDHYRLAPLSPLSPLQLHRHGAGINLVPVHRGSGASEPPMMNEPKLNTHESSDSNFRFTQQDDEREKKRRKKKTNSGTLNNLPMRRDTPRTNGSNHSHLNTLSATNLKRHLNTLLLGDLNISESETNESEMNIGAGMLLAIAPDNSAQHDHVQQHIQDEQQEAEETYDGFLSALGAEIKRQQSEETKHAVHEVIDNEDSQSMQNYKLRINDVDMNDRSRSMSMRPNAPTGYSFNIWDLPATPPLSSCGGTIDTAGAFGDTDMCDTMSVNSDTMRQNKLISIKLIKDDKGNKAMQQNDMKYVQHMNANNKEEAVVTVGDVHFDKFLRMTLLLNIAIDTWSRKWLINGIARSLRTADMRFSVHKAEDIATKYSYVSLLCRCDEYDIKQLKNTFEFSFICHQMEECIAESLGQPQLKIICASCVSYRHFKYLYSKEFLNWMQHSLPNAYTVNEESSQIARNRNDQVYHHLNHDIVQRKQYSIRGMHKMSIANAQHIQLPFAQKDIASRDPMNDKQKHVFHKSFGLRSDDDDENIISPLLTPQNMTVLHFMSVML
eukprot:1068240_1